MWAAARRAAWQAGGLLIAGAMAACSRPEPPVRLAAVPAPPMAEAGADERELILPDWMDLVVDPAAGVVLAAADRHAWTHFDPRTADAWRAVVDAAAQLSKGSELLMGDALAKGRSEWMLSAAALRDSAAAAGAAAERHDPRALYAAGVLLRSSCQGCHARYAPQAAALQIQTVPR
jgi:hypothetical protein